MNTCVYNWKIDCDLTPYFQLQPIPRIDFIDFYYLPMHDRYTGAITVLEFNNDSR